MSIAYDTVIIGCDLGYSKSDTVYGWINSDGRFELRYPRWMKLRAAIGELVPRDGPVVTSVDTERGAVTVGRRP